MSLPTHTTLRCGGCGGTVHVGVDHCLGCKPNMAADCPGCVHLRGVLREIRERVEGLNINTYDSYAEGQRRMQRRVLELIESLEGDE
jgi:hypothetical protein